MKNYDFGISWVYSKDEEFVKILKKNLKKKKFSFYEINYGNVDDVIGMIGKEEIFFKNFIDLSSFEHPVFSILLEKLNSKGINVINSSQSIVKSYSKSKLHKLFEKNNLPLRKTFVISEKTRGFEKIIKELKKPFILSASVSSYENGIVLNANKKEDISAYTTEYSTEKILAHEYKLPKIIDDKTAWFRVMYSCGKILPHWWDPQNHFYQTLGSSKDENKIKKRLELYTRKIADITGLKLFSTEIIIDNKGKYFVIDYANVPMDLSSQEFEKDGVPKKTLNEIAESIAGLR